VSLKTKYVEDRITLMMEMNSSKGMQVFFSMLIHLFVMLCIARSRRMFVNSEVASNESNSEFDWLY